MKCCSHLTMVCLFLITAAGCGSDKGPALGLVTGKVTLSGKPVKGAIVTISPASGSPSMGYTDEDGNYEMQYKFNRAGVVVGTHPVTVDLNNPAVPEKSEMDERESQEWAEKLAADSPISAKWRDGSTTISVEAGSNSFDIELK